MRISPVSLFLVIMFNSLGLYAADNATVVGEVSTTWRLTKNDAIEVERFDDPNVDNVSCYVSRAIKGGVTGMVGLAEDPARMSIACRATGPVKIGNIKEGKAGEEVFTEKASLIFKTIKVTRFYDKDKQVLVYLVWSTKLIDGSPYNNVTAVPIR